uniref:Uncharacterized protein n=1 Tax=Aegilops tauschii subsp. strangulata TaxID=200361 RepID=A0A453ARE7_AEGTS
HASRPAWLLRPIKPPRMPSPVLHTTIQRNHTATPSTLSQLRGLEARGEAQSAARAARRRSEQQWRGTASLPCSSSGWSRPPASARRPPLAGALLRSSPSRSPSRCRTQSPSRNPSQSQCLSLNPCQSQSPNRNRSRSRCQSQNQSQSPSLSRCQSQSLSPNHCLNQSLSQSPSLNLCLSRSPSLSPNRSRSRLRRASRQ